MAKFDDEIMEFAPAGNDDSTSGYPEGYEDDIINAVAGIGLDTEAGLKYSYGDKAFYVEIMGDYINEYADKSTRLESYYEGNVYREYQVLVHSIKSTSRTIGATALSEEAKRLEDAAAEENASYIKEHHEPFMKEYAKLAGELSAVMNKERISG
ncbi:MAG: Hpt domain-containing protein [Lachnospiraceae bacterium]|nr:Hpt domain-containing protein [Lachnospiraceae bacterium]